MSLEESIKTRAQELGFLACGITHPGPSAYADRLDEWLAKGYAGTMRYLHRQAARRKEPQRIAPDARAVVVVLDNYYTPDREADEAAPRMAKYARGEDYHRVTGRRLELLAEFLRSQGAGLSRSFADAGPVPERELAQRAGLGWIGKNTMLVSPDAGSFFFIGSIFTDLPLQPDAAFELDRCGSCTRCLDACPTDAFVSPRVLDATRCISYLTIEAKGAIPESFNEAIGDLLYGCDICQSVCPWNMRFSRELAEGSPFRSREVLAGKDARALARELLAMSDDEVSSRFRGSPMKRAKLRGLKRNAAVVLANPDPSGAVT